MPGSETASPIKTCVVICAWAGGERNAKADRHDQRDGESSKRRANECAEYEIVASATSLRSCKSESEDEQPPNRPPHCVGSSGRSLPDDDVRAWIVDEFAAVRTYPASRRTCSTADTGLRILARRTHGTVRILDDAGGVDKSLRYSPTQELAFCSSDRSLRGKQPSHPDGCGSSLRGPCSSPHYSALSSPPGSCWSDRNGWRTWATWPGLVPRSRGFWRRCSWPWRCRSRPCWSRRPSRWKRIARRSSCLLMTNLSNSELVLGKLLAGMLTVVMVVVAALPLLMLVALLGGVSIGQIVRIETVTLASALAAGSLGSTIALWREKTFQALAMTALVIVLWLVGWEIVATGVLGERLFGIPIEHLGGRDESLASDSGGGRSRCLVSEGVAELVQGPVGWYALAGDRCVAAAQCDGDRARARLESDARDSALATTATANAATDVHRAPGKVREVWDNPVLWREICTRAYGKKVLIVRLAYWVVIRRLLGGDRHSVGGAAAAIESRAVGRGTERDGAVGGESHPAQFRGGHGDHQRTRQPGARSAAGDRSCRRRRSCSANCSGRFTRQRKWCCCRWCCSATCCYAEVLDDGAGRVSVRRLGRDDRCSPRRSACTPASPTPTRGPPSPRASARCCSCFSAWRPACG